MIIKYLIFLKKNILNLIIFLILKLYQDKTNASQFD